MTTRAPEKIRARAPLAACALATGSFVAWGANPTEWPGFVLVAVALVTYAATLRRARDLDGRTVLAVSAGLLVVAVAVPPRASRDYWAYAMYGRTVAIHHASPYVHPPSEYARDPVFERLNPVWQRTRTLYGPLFTAISAAGMAAARSQLAIRLFFQMLAASAILAGLVLVWRRTRDPGALAFLGLHPVVAASVVNSGHNDALVGLAILGGTVLVLDRREALGGVVVAFAALVKVVALLPLAGLAWWVWRQRGARAGRSLAVAGGVVFVAGYATVGLPNALAAMHEGARYITRHSIVRMLVPGVQEGSADAARVVALAALAAVVLAAILVTRAERAGATPVGAAGVSVLAFFLVAAYVLPWYVAWALPLLALERHSVPAALTAGLGGALMFAYWPTRGLAIVGGTTGLLRGLARIVLPVAEIAAIALVLKRAARRSRRDSRDLVLRLAEESTGDRRR